MGDNKQAQAIFFSPLISPQSTLNQKQLSYRNAESKRPWSEVAENNNSIICDDKNDLTDENVKKYCFEADHQLEMAETGINGEDLRSFYVLDEVTESEDESEMKGYNDHRNIDDSKIHDMLDEKIDKSVQKDLPYKEYKTFKLIELDDNYCEIRPENWIKLTHTSGMPIYFHKTTSVCTLSRPYNLGTSKLQDHSIPLSAIPCLQYKRALERKMQHNTAELAPVKIETVQENLQTRSISSSDLQSYCKSLFHFNEISYKKFDSWYARRQHDKMKQFDRVQKASLPGTMKLIKLPVINHDDKNNSFNKEWTLNPNGKSYISILYQYVQHVLRKQPVFEFKTFKSQNAPYGASVLIDDVRYGFGTGISKKEAKSAAAKASLEILIPDLREKIQGDKLKFGMSYSENSETLAIFDVLKIKDPRVLEVCSKTSQPLPYALLLSCLQNNYDKKDANIDFKMISSDNNKTEFIMTLGPHVAKVWASKRTEGKQKAAQIILQNLHPYIDSYGSLLRLYGKTPFNDLKEMKTEAIEVNKPQDEFTRNIPNYELLSKLRAELMKLAKQKQERKPIGVFSTPDTSLPSSNSQLKKINL